MGDVVERIEKVDLAKVDPCPACGTPTRRFAATTIYGTGLDRSGVGPVFCWPCVRSGDALRWQHNLMSFMQGRLR